MTDNHRFMEIDALTCRVTIRFGRDLRKLLILCPSRRCLRLPAGLFKFHCRFQAKLLIISEIRGGYSRIWDNGVLFGQRGVAFGFWRYSHAAFHVSLALGRIGRQVIGVMPS